MFAVRIFPPSASPTNPGSGVPVHAAVSDLNDGTYAVSYIPTTRGANGVFIDMLAGEWSGEKKKGGGRT